jgi:AcrR family transcriptional regulator
MQTPQKPQKTRRRPTQERSRQTVECILEGAARVFDREGLDATTNRIATEAGVSVGSLYEYFPDKAALLHALAKRHIDRARAVIEAAALRWRTTQPSSAELIEQAIALVLGEHEAHPSMHLLITEQAARDEQIMNGAMGLQEAFVHAVTHGLRALLPTEPEPELEVRARMFVFVIGAAVHELLLPARAHEQGDEALLRAHLSRMLQAYLVTEE